MIIQSVRLGELEVQEEELLHFAGGLPGFGGETKFAFVPNGEDSPFAFLQSVNEPNLTFLLADPFAFFNDYQFELDDIYVKELGLGEVLLKVLAIVTVPEKAEEMTVNLLAPIIINLETRLARQIVLENTPFTTKHQLFPAGFPQTAADKGGK